MNTIAKNAVWIILLILLLVSLIWNGYLIVTNIQQSITLQSAKATATAQVSALNNAIATSNAGLITATSDIQKLKNDNSSLSSSVATAIADKNQKSVQLSRALCTHPIPASSINSISTNGGLVDPITQAVEDNWNFNSIDTKYETLWRNNDSAEFSIYDQDHASVKVIVSWNSDTGKIDGIYDIGHACFLYLP